MTGSDLSQMNCVPIRGGEPKLADSQISELLSKAPGWQLRVADGMQRLERVFKFKNFAEALAFTDKVGAAAELEDHHPLIITEWGRVTVQWWTHRIGGLHQNDFIMAAKTDRLATP